MPIIFKFKGNNLKGDDDSSNKDPRTTTLTLQFEDEKYERLASPLILRPYLDEQGEWHSLALVIDDVLCDMNGSSYKPILTDINHDQVKLDDECVFLE